MLPPQGLPSRSSFKARVPVGLPGLASGTWYSVTSPRSGVELAQVLLPEVDVPHHAVRIDFRVVRRRRWIRKIHTP